MRHVRLLAAVLAARFRGRLTAADTSTIPIRVWPTDVDVSIANHAAVLTIMETGRIDFMIRSGFFRLARRNHWYLPLRSLRVQYVRPLKMLQKGTLTTRILHADEDWFYIENLIRSGGKHVAVAVVKGAVKDGRDNVPLDRIAAELGVEQWPRTEPDTIDAIERVDRLLIGRPRDHTG